MKIERNSPCYCGSGKKYKKCCLHSDENLRALRLTHKNNLNKIAIDMGYDYEDLQFFDSDKNTKEFIAMEEWVEEYSRNIGLEHPFRKYLNDQNVTHEMLLTLAMENGWTDYYNKADVLFKKWHIVLLEEIREYFDD